LAGRQWSGGKILMGSIVRGGRISSGELLENLTELQFFTLPSLSEVLVESTLFDFISIGFIIGFRLKLLLLVLLLVLLFMLLVFTGFNRVVVGSWFVEFEDTDSVSVLLVLLAPQFIVILLLSLLLLLLMLVLLLLLMLLLLRQLSTLS
jgi:hypothetical protein